METFVKLFGNFLAFVYHCFDRLVIQGYLPLLAREAHIVHWFRDVHGIYPITPEALKKRTDEYRNWVGAYARNHHIPVERATKGVKKEDYVLPYLKRLEKKNQYGVYFIFQSMEQGNCFHPMVPKFPTGDPNYRIIRRQRRMYTHLYFYLRACRKITFTV